MRVAVGLCVLFAGFSAVLSWSFEYVHLEADQSTSVPDGWKWVERVAPDEDLSLTFALKQQNVDVLEDLFWKVSDPDHEEYGQYLSLEEIAAIVEPSNETVAEVQRWLKRSGVNDCSTVVTKDFMECSMSARTAESLLGDIKFYRYTDGDRTVIRSEVKYLVPRHLTDHLDFVGGVHRFPSGLKVKTMESGNYTSPDVHVGVYPKILRQRYNLTADDVGSHPNNSQCVAQFLEQYYNPRDLAEFFKMFGKGFTHLDSIDKVVGPDTGRSGIEASLDTQYIMSMGANIPTWFWSTGGRHETQEPFLEWMVAIGNTSEVPWVHSVSYGDEESTLSKAYMKRINTEFMKTGVRGITILFASGDDGAGCKDNKFSPHFPASSPYVTTVGGTALSNPFAVSSEYAYEISGGGFSNVFEQPSYQTEKVECYLKNAKLPPQEYYNRTGRAYPDIAALSNHYWIVNNMIPVPGVAGTSASTPVVAGIISMLNEHRLNANKPTMGFLNPFLYKNSAAFYDVTSGCNEASGCLGARGDKAFCATEGWDPVTGVGTPNFPDMVNAAMAK